MTGRYPYLVLQPRALDADLLEPRRNDHEIFDAFLPALPYCCGHELGRDDYDRQVDLAGHFEHALIALEALDLGRIRVDRVDVAFVAGQEVIEHCPAHFTLSFEAPITATLSG